MMAKRTNDKPEMTDAEYAEFQQLQHYDAASLRALALWLNGKKKNAALMKAVSAEMGRNARHLARAVDFFPPFFTDAVALTVARNPITASEYLCLFEYAKLKREDATKLFASYKFGTPLYQLREIIASANARLPRKPSMAEQVIILIDKYLSMKAQYTGVYDVINDITDELAALPAVKSALAKREVKK